MFLDFETIMVGDCASLVKTITEEDIRKFVDMTGDDNPLHVDRAFAESTSFKDIVVHGMLGASFISTVIGTRLPGPGALWISQAMDFLLPVRLGDELTVSCTVVKKHKRERLIDLETRIVNQHRQIVLTGLGTVKLLAFQAPTSAGVAGERPRVAIVTGGAGGIGRAICARLARDGYDVVINYLSSHDRARRVVDDLEQAGHRAIAVHADVTTADGADHLYGEAARSMGPVGLLINCASPRILPKPFSALEWGDVQDQLDGQLKAAFLMSKACVPSMVDRRYGRIVNITSQVVDGPPSVTWTAYAVGKGSLAVFSRYLAAELGPFGVTVNCVSPGMTDTRLIGDIPEKARMIVARQTPMRRLTLPEDVAAAVAYCVSDDGGHVTGQTLRVNGGMVMS